MGGAPRRRRPTADELRREVDRRVRAGEPFERIEEWVNAQERRGVPAFLLAAVWLYAWSFEPAPVQRRLALEALAEG
jgi:hypothetical protein